MKRPGDPSRVGERRFEIGGEAFHRPPGQRAVRKDRPTHRRPPERGLGQCTEPSPSVQVKDVGQLVGDDELEPVVEVGQLEPVDGRWREDRDAIPRGHGRESVARVGVVGDHDVDGRRWRLVELRLEAHPGLLGSVGHARSQVAQPPRIRDSKMLGVEDTPVFVRRLGRDGGCAQDEKPGPHEARRGPPGSSRTRRRHG